MEIDYFTIVSSVNATPSSFGLAIYLGVFVAVFLLSLMLTHRFRKINFPYISAIISAGCFVLSIVLALVGLSIDEARNPNAYTSHITCVYELESPKQKVTYSTLKPRYRSSCAAVGTKVIRIKGTSASMLAQEFEPAN